MGCIGTASTTSSSFLDTTLGFPRAVVSGIDQVELSKHETAILNRDWKDYLFQSSYSQSFLAWRRRNLYMASLFLAISVALQCYDLVQILKTVLGDCKYTALGLAAAVSQAIYPLISFVVLLVAALSWTHYKRSRDILVLGWLLGMVLLLWPNLVPINKLLKEDTLEQRAIVGMANSLAALPMYLALMGGMTKGARKAHVFSPSSLTGAMIVMSAAFSLVIPFAVLSFVVQMVGDALLVVGAFLLLVGPALVVCKAGLYTEITEKNAIITERLDLAATALRLMGFILILLWAILSAQKVLSDAEEWVGISESEKQEIIDELNKVLDPSAMVEKVVQYVGNVMYQAVLWTDIFLFVARNDNAKKMKLTQDLLH